MTSNVNSFESGQFSGTAITTANSGGNAGRAFDSVLGTVTYMVAVVDTGVAGATTAGAGGVTMTFSV